MIPMWMFGVAIAVRQHLHPEAVARRDPSVPVRLAELMMEAGAPDGRAQRRPRRQGDGRRDPRPSGHQGGQLRRLVRHRPLRLLARHREREARAGDGRGQEPRHRHARRRPRPGRSRTSSAPPSARPASAAWRCRWWCRSARRPPTSCASSWSRRSRRCGSASRPTPTAQYGPVVTAAHKQQDRATTSRWASTKAPSWWSTAAASRCRATRRASSSARPCSTT